MQRRGDGFRLEIPALSIFPGRSYAITGPNGSGKTTLLRTLGLLDPPVEGRMWFEGKAIVPDASSNTVAYRRHVTLVMQHAFLFHGSVFDNVAYGLRLRGVPPDALRSRVLEAIEKVGLTGFEKRPARRLSSGETQRVALARALALEPRLLLLDEPTANVDNDNAAIIEAVIGEAQKERDMAVVFSTHQMDQAHRLAGEARTLRDGRMLDVGPVNLYPGEVEPDGTTVRLHESVILHTVTERRGEVYVHIPPDDIIISREALVSSARNSLPGAISRAAVADPFVDLTIDAGISLTVRITRRSFTDLGLNVGDRVYATFKSSAVRIL